MPAGALIGQPGVSAEQRVEETQAMSAALRTQLAFNSNALSGAPCPADVFSGLAGLAAERVQQLESFVRGEAFSVSGSGMGRENLERLQELSAALEQYGITVEVNVDEGSFILTNNNYIPMGMVPEETRTALADANNFALSCLEQADSLISQGRLDEADAYVRWAGAIQARYSEYVEGARVLEALLYEKDGLSSLPPVGVSEQSAREKLSEIAGQDISTQEFPAEFERRMGVTWEEFRTAGFASLAMYSMDVAIASMQEGLAALETRMREMGAASGEAITGADMQAYLPPQEYVSAATAARDNLIFAASVRDDIYTIMGVRKVAEELRGLRFEGAPAYADMLDGERDRVVGMYVQAESSVAESLFLRSAVTENSEESARNYARAQEIRLRGADFLARGEGMIPGLDAKYALASRYTLVQDTLMESDFGKVSASDREELILERDNLVDEITRAVREGKEVENLEEKVSVLDRRYKYTQIRDFWAGYQFEGVEGVAGKYRLESDRDALLDSLEGALQSGMEVANLDGMQDDLLATHERCAAFERLIKTVYATLKERLLGIEGQFYAWSGSVGHTLGVIPAEVRGIQATPGFEAAATGDYYVDTDALLADYTQAKRQIKNDLFAMGDNVRTSLGDLLGALDACYAEAMGYEPASIELYDEGSGITNLRERFSFDANPAMEKLRIVHERTEVSAANISARIAEISNPVDQMVNEYNHIVESQQTAAALYQVRSALELASAAVVGIWAVWNLPTVFAAGRSIANAGRSALAEIEAVSPMAAAGIRLSVTGLSLGLSAYGGVEFSEGVSSFRSAETAEEKVAAAEQMFEGALWIGSLGFASRLSPGLLRTARAISVGLDAAALATIAPSVASVGYAMAEKGDVGGWDVAEIAFWTGLALAGAYIGIRAAGGIRAIRVEGAEIAKEVKVISIDEFARTVMEAPRSQAGAMARSFAAEAAVVEVAVSPAPTARAVEEGVAAGAVVPIRTELPQTLAPQIIGVTPISQTELLQPLRDLGIRETRVEGLLQEFQEFARKYPKNYEMSLQDRIEIMTSMFGDERAIEACRALLRSQPEFLLRNDDSFSEMVDRAIDNIKEINNFVRNDAGEVERAVLESQGLDYFSNPSLLTERALSRDDVVGIAQAAEEAARQAAARPAVEQYIAEHQSRPAGVMPGGTNSEEIMATLESMGFSRSPTHSETHRIFTRTLADRTVQVVNVPLNKTYNNFSKSIGRFLKQDKPGPEGTALVNEYLEAFYLPDRYVSAPLYVPPATMGR